MSGKRLTKEQKAALVADLRAGKKTFRSIAVDHNCSISTVSKLAAELGLSSPRKKSKPTEQQNHSYDKPRRIAVLDRMLKSIEVRSQPEVLTPNSYSTWPEVLVNLP